MAPKRDGNDKQRLADQLEPPVDIPSDPREFWRAGAGFDELTSVPDHDDESVLKKLGPLPFPKGRFPLMGFLATLYDHVADQAGDALPTNGR